LIRESSKLQKNVNLSWSSCWWLCKMLWWCLSAAERI